MDSVLDGAVTLGIDLATASARCVAVDTWTGAVLVSASTSLPEPVRSAGSRSTQEPAYAAAALGLVSRVVAALGGSATRVRAISVTGTSGTVVPLDARGRPVAPARLYDDTSGAGVAAAQGLSSGSMLARLAVTLHSAQASGLEVARLGSTADVVHCALVEELVAGDTSHFLKAGIDARTGAWPTETEHLGLTDVVPPLVAPGVVLGRVSPGSARRLGLGAEVAVVSGMTDGCTAQVSTGAIHPGDTVGVLGTTLVLKAVATTPVASGDGAVYSHRAPDGAWWPGGASNVGGGTLSARTPSITDRELGVLDMGASRRGPAGVVCYPLARPGERFPVSDPRLPPLWSGQPADEVEAHRAVLEGVAFVERLALERLAVLGAASRRHVLAGGATRSGAWQSVRATVLHDRHVATAAGGGSAVGAAVLAAAALTRMPFRHVVDQLVAEPSRVVAVEGEIERLEASYATFLRLLGDALGHDPLSCPRDTPIPATPPRAAAAPTEGTSSHA